MNLRTRFEKADPLSLSLLLICALPVSFIAFYALSSYTASNLIFYIGLYVCGIISFIPLALLTTAVFLWANPAKNKEYEMKQSRSKKVKEKQTYLLLLLGILWLRQKDFEKVD